MGDIHTSANLVNEGGADRVLTNLACHMNRNEKFEQVLSGTTDSLHIKGSFWCLKYSLFTFPALDSAAHLYMIVLSVVCQVRVRS